MFLVFKPLNHHENHYYKNNFLLKNLWLNLMRRLSVSSVRGHPHFTKATLSSKYYQVWVILKTNVISTMARSVILIHW